MTTQGRRPDEDVFARAREAFWQRSREEKLDLMRRAGVLSDQPRLGDKIRARDALGGEHFAVVVGVDDARGVWMVVRNGGAGVELATLEAFAGGGTVELVDRAVTGAEETAVKAALEMLGQAVNLRDFRYQSARMDAVNGGAALVGLAAASGLTLAADALLRDRSWDEGTGRYRDRRGRFTG